jgi:hypothetical protein
MSAVVGGANKSTRPLGAEHAVDDGAPGAEDDGDSDFESTQESARGIANAAAVGDGEVLRFAHHAVSLENKRRFFAQRPVEAKHHRALFDAAVVADTP